MHKSILILTVILPVIALNIRYVNAHSGDTVYANYGNSPVIDGIINPAEWSAAGIVRFPNSTDSVTAYFLSDGSSLYIALDIPDNTNNSFDDSGFNIDPLHNGGTSCQQDDFLFRMNRAGDDKREGNYCFPGNTPTGWIVATGNVTGGWQVEYKFSFTKLGIPPNTQKTLGLFIHTWNDAVGSEDNFPVGNNYTIPDLWADIIISVSTAVTGIPDPKNEISVFPNPANNYTIIRFPNASNENHTLIIYDSTGQLMQIAENITGTDIKTETVKWNNGLYFFQLHNNSGAIGNGKFIINDKER